MVIAGHICCFVSKQDFPEEQEAGTEDTGRLVECD
jgi:hypothetical protein